MGHHLVGYSGAGLPEMIRAPEEATKNYERAGLSGFVFGRAGLVLAREENLHKANSKLLYCCRHHHSHSEDGSIPIKTIPAILVLTRVT